MLLEFVTRKIASGPEDILTQMPPGGQGPSPRVLKRLEDAEEALKAQYKRMNDAYKEAIVSPDLKQDEDDQIEAFFKKARDAKDQTLNKLMKVLDDHQPTVQGLNQGPPAKRSMRIEEVFTSSWRASVTLTNWNG